MKYNSQIDMNYANDDMAIHGDTISMYGCLLSCIANNLQEHSQTEYTPKQLNIFCRTHGGYKWFIEHKESNASEINWNPICDTFLFNISVSKVYNIGNYFTAEFRNKCGYALHYMNVIKKTGHNILCFNPLNSDLEYHDETDINQYLVMKFK